MNSKYSSNFMIFTFAFSYFIGCFLPLFRRLLSRCSYRININPILQYTLPMKICQLFFPEKPYPG